MIIAIDGPAGSGKSTLGERLAKSLGFLYFDTGVMYRAVTWKALVTGVDILDEVEITSLAEKIDIDVRPPTKLDGRSYDVLLDGQDITWEIRQKDVDANVSIVSAYSGVRHALSALQRCIGLRGQVVMVGRDIGTVVLPDADLKIFLDASIEERVRRRYDELVQRGVPVVKEEVLKLMKERDRIDSTRSLAPLKPAEDAVIIDSDGLNADQVLHKVSTLLEGG
jgi:CMP/dCMP kinase